MVWIDRFTNAVLEKGLVLIYRFINAVLSDYRFINAVLADYNDMLVDLQVYQRCACSYRFNNAVLAAYHSNAAIYRFINAVLAALQAYGGLINSAVLMCLR